ncbi:MAG: response regulator [Deltaproteobacteria bacterium]|nr:response regulator [Deltaproteobacteria bacterium]
MRRILFVDGEPHIRWLCREELQDEGYEVLVAGSGGDVVRMVDTYNPDVVILEVVLPDMSGLETGRMVKGTSKRTRLIYYSHCQPPPDPAEWGADAYVQKSSDLADLKETLRSLLRNHL